MCAFTDMTFVLTSKTVNTATASVRLEWAFFCGWIITINYQDTVISLAHFGGFKHTSTITDHWGSLNNSRFNEIRQGRSIQRYSNQFIPIRIFTSLPKILWSLSPWYATTMYRVAQKERMFFNLPAIYFFGVTSNQKSTFENLVKSTIWKFPFAKKLQLCHNKC